MARLSNGKLKVTGNGILVTDALSLSPAANGFAGGILDLADNDLIVHGGSLSATQSLLANGYNGGAWNDLSNFGSGPAPAAIDSSAAAENYNYDGIESLGDAEVGQPSSPTAGLFDGQSVSDGDVVVRFTYYGDANLDGAVNSVDETALANGEANNLTGWNNGDFDYSGVIDDNDAALLDASESFDLAAPLPPAAENQLYSFTLPGDAVEANTEISTIQNWQVRWGDGFFNNYTVPAGGSPDVLASHTYATPNVGGYAVSIIASGSGGYGSRSHIYTLVLPHEDVVVAPDAPTDLSATESTAGEVDLTWADDTELAAGYVVTATPTTGGTTITQNYNSSTFAAALTGLTPDVSYTFGVAADNTLSDGISAQSAAATTTAIAPAAALTATGPTNVNEGTTGSALNLSSGSSSNITGWQVIWTDESGNVLSTDTVTGSSGTDAYPSPMPLELNATITARDSAGNSFVLPTFTAVLVPNAPTAVTDSVASSTEIDLSWVDRSSVAVEDFIYESTDGGATFNPLDEVTPATAGSDNTYDATGLTPNVAYKFYVTADTGYAESTPSNTVSASTPFVAPTLDVEGTGTVVEGQPYQLSLTADYPDGEAGTVNHWLVDWNDGPGGTSNVISYSYPAGADSTQPLVVTHVFNVGIASSNVTVTAVDSVNGSFVADPQPVAVTPSAPTGLSASVSGDLINVTFTTTSSISTGTTLLISTDDSTFYEASDTAVGTGTGTISDLSLDTHYWVEIETDGINGTSATTAAVSAPIPYAQPALVVTPEAPPQEGQPYAIALSATYATGTPESDMIASWSVDWGDGQGPQSYSGQSVIQSDSYSSGTTAATVLITALDGTGRQITTSQSLAFAPPTPTNVSDTMSADGTSATITWQGSSNIPGQYVIQRLDPGTNTWVTAGNISATANGTNNSYSFTDPTLSPVSDGTVGYIYRVASQAPGITSDAPGTMGVSPYAAASESPGPASTGPSGIVYANDVNGPGLYGVTGQWTPAIASSGGYTEFANEQTTTLTIGNLPPHLAIAITVYTDCTGYSASDKFILTGSNGQQVIDTANPTGEFVLNLGYIDHNNGTETFTLQGIIPGTNPDGTQRVWSASGTQVTVDRGHINVGNEQLDVGGEAYMPVSMDSLGMPCAGDVLTVESFDPNVLKPLTDTVTLDADGQGELLVEGTGVGQTSLVLRNSIGDQGSAEQGATPPLITSTGHVTQGASYNSTNMPGFTFTAPYPSVSPVVVNYTTAGSTVPTSLRSPFGTTGSETLPAGSNPTLFVPYTPPDDDKIAPDRELVLTPIMIGVPAYPFGPTTRMVVTNTDVPTITYGGTSGGSDNATIQLDPQGDSTKLTDISMPAGQYDQVIVSTTLTWKASDFTIWLQDKIGAPGTDLGSLPGAYHNPYTGGVSYTWPGDPPANVYGQCMNGSSNWDQTIVTRTANVLVEATPVVGVSTGDASKNANGTANGAELVWAGSSKPVTGVVAGNMLIGQGVSVQVVWSGPVPGNEPYSTYQWFVSDAVSGYSDGVVTPLDINTPPYGESPASGFNQSVHFYWSSDALNGADKKENVTCSGTYFGIPFSVSTTFDVWTPAWSFYSDLHFASELSIVGPDSDRWSLGDSPPGVRYHATVNMAKGSAFAPGQWGFTQLMKPSRIYTLANAHVWSLATTGVAGLDTSEWYGFPNPDGSPGPDEVPTSKDIHELIDTPNGRLNLDIEGSGNAFPNTNLDLNDSYMPYLMFTPSGDSIDVPLAVASWGYHGSYSLSNRTLRWQINTKRSSYANDGVAIADFPVWQYVVNPKDISGYSRVK